MLKVETSHLHCKSLFLGQQISKNKIDYVFQTRRNNLRIFVFIRHRE